jgi:hypothetical protein
MATTSVTASVPTEQGSRYLQQLCKHWAHKMPVEFDAHAGKITFPDGAIANLTAHAATLEVRLDIPEGGDVAQMEHVVASHLDRFAFREAPLPFAWAVV